MEARENVSKVYIMGDVGDHGLAVQGEGITVSSAGNTLSLNNSNIDPIALQKELDEVVEEMHRTAKTSTQFAILTEAVKAKEAMESSDKNRAIEHIKNCGKWLLDVSKQVGAQVIVKLITGS